MKKIICTILVTTGFMFNINGQSQLYLIQGSSANDVNSIGNIANVQQMGVGVIFNSQYGMNGTANLTQKNSTRVNFSDLRQAGNGNLLNVDQNGSNGSITVDQKNYTGNISGNNGEQHATIVQGGTSNQLLLIQATLSTRGGIYASNDAEIQQLGAGGNITVVQSNRDSRHATKILQDASSKSDIVTLFQTGSGNYAEIYQQGTSYNTVYLSQNNGDPSKIGNMSFIYQKGLGNAILADVNGSNNIFNASQNGNNNFIKLNSTVGDNAYGIIAGNNNDIRVTQNGDNKFYELSAIGNNIQVNVIQN